MSLVEIARSDGLVTVRLNRPPVNAIELELAREAAAAVTAATEDPSARAIIVTGSGTSLCGGLDLKVVPTYDATGQRELEQRLGELLLALYAAPRPVVVAANGHAVAAGTLLCLCADWVVAPDRDTRFGLTGARVGIPYPESAMIVIRDALSTAAARRLLLSARTFDQSYALTQGVVDECVPRERVLDRAREVALDLGSMPVDTYAQTKYQLRGETAARLQAAADFARRKTDGVWIARDIADSANDR